MNQTEKVHLAVKSRQSVLQAGKWVLFVIAFLSLLSVILGNYHVIPVVVILGFIVMAVWSVIAAERVKRKTGLTHREQKMVWDVYKSPIF